MELGVEDYVNGVLSKEAFDEPSDSVKASELVLELPPWYNEEKYKLGQKFYWDNLFGAMTSMLTGLLAVLAVPSILAVLVHTRRSSSVYTSYRRYLATILHTVAWHKHPLKPGSIAWKSLHAVRSRHLRASTSANAAGLTHISQRDLALTQFGFVGFAMTRPDELGLSANDEEGWEGLNHFWRTIGHMIGLKDEYNICRADVDQTRAVCERLRMRVFAPCLENVPEPFEHMARVLLDGMWAVNPNIEETSMLFFTRYLAGVPGYVYTEQERIKFRAAIKTQLLELPLGAVGVESKHILPKPEITGLPDRPPIIYKPDDYITLETVPAFRKLSSAAKYNVNKLIYLHRFFYTTAIGRWFLNWNMRFSFWLLENFPFLAFPRFGYKKSFANLFAEGPKDDTVPLSNVEVLKTVIEEKPWYSWLFDWKF